jgi:hypothetical protein
VRLTIDTPDFDSPGDYMTTFDDREKGFERKFVEDEAQEFRAIGRRNRMLAEWAAGLMGLEKPEDYVKAIIKSEIEHPDEEHVVRKVVADLKSSGVETSEGAVRNKMDELLAIARDQLARG